MNRKLLPIGFSLLALVASSYAMADDGAYLGARVGSEMDDRFDFGLGDVDADTPYSVYGGWNFNDHWGVELGYVNVGNSKATAATDAGFNLDGHMFTGGVSYRFPVADRFDMFAALGAFDLNEDGQLISIAGSAPFDNNDSGVYAEFGARYHFNGPIALRASYQWFDFDAGSEGTPWLGVEFGF